MGTGTALETSESFPSTPFWLHPQHTTAPAAVRAHAADAPMETATAVSGSTCSPGSRWAPFSTGPSPITPESFPPSSAPRSLHAGNATTTKTRQRQDKAGGRARRRRAHASSERNRATTRSCSSNCRTA